jgi:protein SCO1/2
MNIVADRLPESDYAQGMSLSRKTVTIGLWVFVVVGLLGLLAIQRQRSERDRLASLAVGSGNVAIELNDQGLPVRGAGELPVLFEAPSFQAINQASQPFDSASLEGHVWTAMFFFSECQGVCPGMMARLRSLHSQLPDPRVRFVSFTVDPANDTPERLAQYAASIGPNESRWHLLTGSVEQMKQIAAEFLLPYEQPADHSSKILLVDQQGRVRGLYSTGVADEMRLLTVDAASLLDGTASATVP